MSMLDRWWSNDGMERSGMMCGMCHCWLAPPDERRQSNAAGMSLFIYCDSPLPLTTQICMQRLLWVCSTSVLYVSIMRMNVNDLRRDFPPWLHMLLNEPPPKARWVCWYITDPHYNLQAQPFSLVLSLIQNRHSVSCLFIVAWVS